MNFANNILKQRNKLNLSQEDFAEKLNVTKETIQNWENNNVIPDNKTLLELANKLNISIYELFVDNKDNIYNNANTFVPTRNRYVWECYENDLITEYNASTLEGKDIKKYEDLFQAVSLMENSKHKIKIADVLFNIINESKIREDYKYYEPSSFEEIKKCATTLSSIPFNKNNIRDKINGAWLGRICGCLLGKPVEGNSIDEIAYLLKHSNNYPMHRYINLADITDDIKEKSNIRRNNTFGDNISAAPTDDDTNYMVLAEKILEEFGRDFTPENILDAWVKYQPKDSYCTAERVAWMNYVNGYMPPYTAIYKNPYRDWIGAQIRIDFYGYINPGNVEEAVKMAYKDASISHTKNGIYGALYIAAMIARAGVCDNVEEVINVGLSQIPKTSKFYEHVSKIIEMYKSGKTEEDCFNLIYSMYNEHINYCWCSAISNSMIITLALLYHQNNYGDAICCAVQAGFDTDCNGATVGSIFGMMHGASCIEEKWLKPINGKLQTNIFGYECVAIDELVEKTLKYIEQ